MELDLNHIGRNRIYRDQIINGVMHEKIQMKEDFNMKPCNYFKWQNKTAQSKPLQSLKRKTE